MGNNRRDEISVDDISPRDVLKCTSGREFANLNNVLVKIAEADDRISALRQMQFEGTAAEFAIGDLQAALVRAATTAKVVVEDRGFSEVSQGRRGIIESLKVANKTADEAVTGRLGSGTFRDRVDTIDKLLTDAEQSIVIAQRERIFQCLIS